MKKNLTTNHTNEEGRLCGSCGSW